MVNLAMSSLPKTRKPGTGGWLPDYRMRSRPALREKGLSDKELTPFSQDEQQSIGAEVGSPLNADRVDFPTPGLRRASSLERPSPDRDLWRPERLWSKLLPPARADSRRSARGCIPLGISACRLLGADVGSLFRSQLRQHLQRVGYSQGNSPIRRQSRCFQDG
jgi:hypothetical protein